MGIEFIIKIFKLPGKRVKKVFLDKLMERGEVAERLVA
jgi:hypothetical protein